MKQEGSSSTIFLNSPRCQLRQTRNSGRKTEHYMDWSTIYSINVNKNQQGHQVQMRMELQNTIYSHGFIIRDFYLLPKIGLQLLKGWCFNLIRKIQMESQQI